MKLAETAKDLYRRIGLPGYKGYIKAVMSGAIMNCPVNVEDIKRAIGIWGKDAIGLKGRDVRRSPEPTGWINDIPLPPEVLEHHRSTMISVNYTFIHGLPHFHYCSRGYCFRAVEYIPRKIPTKRDSIRCLKKVLNVFEKRGIDVNPINADGEFECVCDDVQPTDLNVVVAGEYVSDIKRGNRSLKDGTRCEVHRCLYRWYPREMVKGCVIRVTKNHNDYDRSDVK